MRNIGIALAAGMGRRMGEGPAKQYRQLLGRPVLFYPLKAMEASSLEGILLVCAPGDEDWVRQSIVEQYGFSKVMAVIAGGRERADSVYAALEWIEARGLLEEEGLVLVHDGARAFVEAVQIDDCLEAAAAWGAAVLAVPCKDTLRLGDALGFGRGVPPREHMWQIQTPQAFRFGWLLEAHRAWRRGDVQRAPLGFLDFGQGGAGDGDRRCHAGGVLWGA